MPEIEQRLDKVEERLGSVEKKVDVLDGKVAALDGKVTALDGKVAVLATDVQKLRVLGEENERQLKVVAEVQARHGERLDEHSRMLEKITRDIEPLKVLPAAVQQIAKDMAPLRDVMERITHDHEARITELEKRAGVRE